MTEEEKQRMMMLLMREQEENAAPVDIGGHMMALSAPQPGSQDGYSEFQGQPQQSQGGMSPMQMQQFAGGGEAAQLAGGSTSVSGLASGTAPVAEGALYGGFGSAPAAVPAGEGIAAAGGGSGSGSMLAAAGPWAALAAVIAVNEKQGRDKGRRSEDPGRHLQQALTGEGMATDLGAVGDRVGGPLGKSIGFMGKMGSPVDATKWAVDKGWKPWEWF